ncbi:MAG: AsmA family protein [Wenzhouxiangellaceae bacterium]|nr:AsmA family protein [Wenzhouxiangellaceae bacterium]
MRALLIFIAAVVVIILGIWATLVIYFDEARLKQIATEQVRAQTGRELQINGPLELDFFPGVSLVAREVSLSGPKRYTGPELFTADEFRMSLSLLPLLSGRIETGDIELEQARVNIHTDASGVSSLDGLTGGETAEVPAGAAPEVTTGRIQLQDIRLTVSNAATDSRQVFVVERLGIESFRYDEPVAIEYRGSVGDPPTVSDIDLSGKVTVPSGPGPVKVSDLSVTAQASGLPLALSGNAEVRTGPPLVARFSDGLIRLGDHEFQSDFAYRDGERPSIEATLTGKMLDVDALLAALPPTEAPDDGAPAEPGGGQAAAEAESPLLLLRDMDLDARLDLERMRVSGLELQNIKARMQAVDGVVTIDPLSGALSGGRVDAIATIDLNAEPPDVRLAPVFDLESLSSALEPWGLDRFLTGSGVLDMELNARGLEPSAILATLNGSGRYNFSDGSIKGLNLDGMVDALASRDVVQAASAGVGGTTKFETFAGTLEIRDGTIRMPGIDLVTRALGITGDVRLGLADLGLDGTLQLQSERLDTIPVRLGGTLTDPSLAPDLGAAVKQEAGRRIMDLLEKRAGKDDKEGDGNGG